MKNSNVSEKSKGVLLFAFNTDTVDYVNIALQSTRLIHHYLNLPVTVVTDKQPQSNKFDNVIIVDHVHTNFKNAEQKQWRNADRYRAYELSPYDETLLLDSDYLVLDNNLLKLFDSTVDYRLQHQNIILDDTSKFDMGMTSLPFLWATIVLFKKTQRSQMLFDLVGRIQRNYQYYRLLYNIREKNFRNDYAFAIANNILNGYDISVDQSIPWPMLSVYRPITAIESLNNNIIVRHEESAHVLPKQSLHVMYKPYLISDAYVKLVDELCLN
jgi:hypothetical protein